MKVRSLVDKFTLKEKKKYITKGRIYDVLHEEEKGYVVNDVDGEDVILRPTECEVVEYDNPKEMDRVIVKDKVIKEKPKMKCEVLDSKYSHRLRQAIQCFLEENKIEEVISLSCYFDSSTDYHVAVIIYK